MIRYASALVLILFFAGCSTHPTIPTTRLQEGESARGVAFSIENVFPYYYYQYGLSDISSLGLRIGLPVYGSGFDYSRIIFQRGRSWDLINLSWSLNHNPNIDFTYYKVFSFGAETANKAFWFGFRGMYIPTGISDNSSTRIGLVLGTSFSERLSLELGYCHDFSAMPLGKVFSFDWDHEDPKNIEYIDKPHISESGMPSEYSRLTGISLKLVLKLKDKKIKTDTD